MTEKLNKLRKLVLTGIWMMLILLPMIHVYQNYAAAHIYDRLAPQQQRFYDTMELLTSPFVTDPVEDLNAIKGSTWSATLFGMQLSDPLAVAGQSAAEKSLVWPFVLTALLPLVATLLLGRFFCGWLCPAALLFELNDNLSAWLTRMNRGPGKRALNVNVKYLVLALGLVFCFASGMAVFAAVYPPAIIAREIYLVIAAGGLSIGVLFLVGSLLFDLLVSRRGFCRYLCPGGALYALLGRYRLIRIQRKVHLCHDCQKCNAVCPYELNPMQDDFGQECNQCTACMEVCDTRALTYTVALRDVPFQGSGRLSRHTRAENAGGHQANEVWKHETT